MSLTITASALSIAHAATTTPCMDHTCSNDYTRNHRQEPVYGDELLVWEPNPGWASRECDPSRTVPCVTKSTLRCYELVLYPELSVVVRRCENTEWNEEVEGWVHRPPPAAAQPYATEAAFFPRYGAIYEYVVRACEGTSCGEWSEGSAASVPVSVEFIGGKAGLAGWSHEAA